MAGRKEGLNKLFRQNGFTLIECVMTMVVIAILSSAVLPKFFNLSAYQERFFFNDVLAAIRYAQKLASATECNVQVTISGDTFYLKRPGAVDRSQCGSTAAADFTLDVANPGIGTPPYRGSQKGISLTSATFYFNASGTASTGHDIQVGARRKITVVKETGFVYDSTP